RLGPNSSKPHQSQSKPNQETKLVFSWIPSSDSGLFRGLRAIQVKKRRTRFAVRPSCAARPAARHGSRGERSLLSPGLRTALRAASRPIACKVRGAKRNNSAASYWNAAEEQIWNKIARLARD